MGLFSGVSNFFRQNLSRLLNTISRTSSNTLVGAIASNIRLYAENTEAFFEQIKTLNSDDKEGTDALIALIEKGIDLNVLKGYHLSPLLCAAKDGHTKIVKALLNKGANPDVKAIDGHTALDHAIRHGHTKAAKALLKKGANPNSRDLDGNTSLHHAATYRRTEIAKLLIANNATIDVQNYAGNTPLHLTMPGDNTELIKLLIANMTTLDIQNDRGEAPIYTAAKYQHTANVKLLIDNNAKVDIKDEYGVTPLHYAAIYGNTELIKLLIASNATIDIQDSLGNTPLNKAVSNNPLKLDAIWELLNSNAKINVINRTGRTLLQFTRESPSTDFFKQFIGKIIKTMQGKIDSDQKNKCFYALQNKNQLLDEFNTYSATKHATIADFIEWLANNQTENKQKNNAIRYIEKLYTDFQMTSSKKPARLLTYLLGSIDNNAFKPTPNDASHKEERAVKRPRI